MARAQYACVSFALAVALLLLTACDAPGDAQATAAEPPVVTASADPPEPAPAGGAALLGEIDRRMAGASGYRRRLSAEEQASYAIYKAVAHDQYAAGTLELGEHAGSEGFDMLACGQLNILEQEGMAPREFALQQAAARFVQLEQDLARAGYDPALYALPLASLEQRRLQLMTDELANAPYVKTLYEAADQDPDAIERAFADAVEPLRRARQPDRPRIMLDGGCGDGEVNVPFAIRPADGVARILRAFSFDVCAKRKLDPWDADRCRGWVSVRDGGSLPVSGTYRVQIRWPDGRAYRGDFTTQGFDDEADVKPIRFDAPARQGLRP